jgi:hypothetical protein
MESIADYAVRRQIIEAKKESLGPIQRKRKSSAMGGVAARPIKRVLPGGFGGDDDDDDDEDDTRRRESKKPRKSIVEDAAAPRVMIAEPTNKEDDIDAQREREALRRKLDLQRARRRSSRGRQSMGGRNSMGKGPLAPQGIVPSYTIKQSLTDV